MENDFEIDVFETIMPDEQSEQLPANILLKGNIESDDIKVYIRQEVYKELEDYSATDIEHERGSILLGTYNDAMGKMNVVVSDYIEAKYTDASASTLTFTHETWAYVNREKDAKYNNSTILGWQHTHPGYGVFLSNYDMFIQENFFNLPFQIAYVIDPIQHTRGFFQWKNGKVERLKGYYIYDEVGKPIKIKENLVEPQQGVAQKSGKNHLTTHILGIALLICTLSSVLMVKGILSREISRLAEKVVLLQNTVDRQSEELVMAKRKVEREKTVEDDYAPTTQESNNTKIDVECENEAKDIVMLKRYTIVEGDSLSSICEKNGIDYSDNIKVIMSINGIADSNMIYAGEQLLLPYSQ